MIPMPSSAPPSPIGSVATDSTDRSSLGASSVDGGGIGLGMDAELLGAVTGGLYGPAWRPGSISSARDALRYGEAQYEQGLQLLREEQESGGGGGSDAAGEAFMRSISVCQEVLGDVFDSSEEEELEQLISQSEAQLDAIRAEGWSAEVGDAVNSCVAPHPANHCLPLRALLHS
jgi:hypothetical protein